MKTINLYITLLGLMFFGCSENEQKPEKVTFTDGYFIIKTGNKSTGTSGAVLFHPYADDDLNRYYSEDIFLEVNNEKIPGFLLDMVVNSNKACILSRDEKDRLIIADKLTMLKEKEIILNSAESIAIFLTEENIHIITHDFKILTVNIESEQITSTRDLSFLSGAISDVKFYENKIYFSTNGEIGKVHIVNMKVAEPLITFNIGPSINSIVPLEDGIYITGEEPFNSYDTSNLVNPTITNGIIKIDPFSGAVNQIVASEYPYPFNLTFDNGLFLFLQSRYKSHPSNTISKFWNKTTGELSEPLKHLRPTYKSASFITLKNSRIYILAGEGINILDMDSEFIRWTRTGANASKIVFLDKE
jgi:hypothetical protein